MIRWIPFVVALAACRGDQPSTASPRVVASRPGVVTIHAPARLEGLATGELDDRGQPVRVACETCHSLRTPTQLPTTTAELDEFHQGLRFNHGEMTCGSCHVAGDQRSLRRADGTLVAMRDAIILCRQCHGPQARDYDHGAHGGMTGYWDLSAGDRVRNHCVDCHDPHSPQFQGSRPVLPPRDRGGIR